MQTYRRYLDLAWLIAKFTYKAVKEILWWTAPFIVFFGGLTLLWQSLIGFMIAMSHEDDFRMALNLFKLGGLGVGTMIGEKISQKIYG